MRVGKHILYFLAIGCLFSCQTAGRADGIFVPPIFDMKVPGIPNQRALIVFDKGIEELTIESTADASTQDLGWIIPVPSEPLDIHPGNRGIFIVSELTFYPALINSDLFPLLVIGILFVLFLCLMNNVSKFARSALLQIMYILPLSVLILLIYTIDTRKLGNTEIPQSTVPGVSAAPVITVGNYAAQMLDAKSAESLNLWLEENGYQPLAAEGQSIVQDYIKEGWRFVAAKLRSEKTGRMRPHPISLRFATEKPVYPMRLTRLAGTDVHLDLYVIADKRMTVRGMETIFSDKLRKKSAETQYALPESSFTRYETVTFRKEVGFTRLTKFMWDGCVITRLSSVISSRKMKKDFWVEPNTDNSPYRKPVYREKDARKISVAIGILCVCLMDLGCIFYLDSRNKARTRRNRFKAILIALPVGGLIGLGVFLLLPTAAVMDDTPENNGALFPYFPNDDSGVIEVPSAMSMNEIEADLLSRLNGKLNPYTNEPYQLDACPGDYVVFQDGENTIVRFFVSFFRRGVGRPWDSVVVFSGISQNDGT